MITLKEPTEDEAAAFRARLATPIASRRFQAAKHLAALYTIMNECRMLEPTFSFPPRFVAELSEALAAWECVRT